MGYNLSGLLIKPAIPDKTLLEKTLGWELVDEATVIFEEATLNKYDNTYVDVYTTESGTLVLADTSFYEKEKGLRQLSKQGELVTFALSETAMAFYFQKYAAGVFQWEDGIIMEASTQRIGDSDLQLDEETDIVFDTFGDLSAEYLGVNFHQVPLETPVTRYRVQKVMQTVASLPPVRQEDVFPIFNQFLSHIANNKISPVYETPERKLYSFETYLRSNGCTPDIAAAYAAYMKHSKRTFIDNREKPIIKKKGTSLTFSLLLILLAIHAVLFAIVSLLLLIVEVSVWTWQAYLLSLLPFTALVHYKLKKRKPRPKQHLRVKFMDADAELEK